MSNHYTSAPPQRPVSDGRQTSFDSRFEACAATASFFLYAEGSSVVCLHHDSLARERVFDTHTHDVTTICVDNVSERGAGRLVVTYDTSKTSIVWDLFTGEQVSRFASYESLTAAAWMRNGNLAFGNENGEVVLYEPSTSEHVSARTIFDPITAIAPAADCRTYAIGYRNGSILLASLQPHFTILHTLSTSRAPSPIAGLVWHASSSKQKSDMLATHTVDGDLRVWSVSKPPSNNNPRVIRALRRSDVFMPTKNWISWSKNGRILQYSEGEIWAWDVRTKDVTHELVLASDELQGVAAYGPTGALFVLGRDQSIQQYDVDQAALVASIRRMPMTVPQTPPQEIAQPIFHSESESEAANHSQSMLDAYAAEAARMEKTRTATPQSTQGRVTPMTAPTFSPAPKTERTGTSVSASLPAALPREVHSPSSNRSGRKTSRLRQEVIMSPEERPIADLFPLTRARLSDVPYRQARVGDENNMTQDDLRQQMLSVVFGWDDDIYSLINEELSRLPTESAHAVFLAKWLGNSTDNIARAIMVAASDPTLNWMRLALSAISDSADSKKIAQVLTEQMLLRGDVHAAVTLLVACGDHNDAIEVYVSRKQYMEAVLLACLLMPTEWQRLSFLVRKWGEHVVSNAEHYLAVRCFSCIGTEPSEPWTSPSVQPTAVTTTSPLTLLPSVYHKTMERRSHADIDAQSPPLSPPATRDTAPTLSRSDSQTSGLKLVTSFAGQDLYKFPGLMSDEGTPINAALVTPIADSALPRSALSPGGMGVHRPNTMRSLNAALSSKPMTPGGMNRVRLPSIGEAAGDSDAQFPAMIPPRAPPTPADSGSDKEREKAKQAAMDPVKFREELPLLLTPARYEPPGLMTGKTPQTAISTRPPVSYPETSVSDDSALKRNSSRSRKPEGLSLRMFDPREDESQSELLTSQSYGDVLERPRTTDSVNSIENADFASPPHTGNSLASQRSLRSPSTTGRSIDQYISSLEQAQYYKSRARGNSLSGKQSRDDAGDKKKYRTRDRSVEVGARRHEGRSVPPGKRSPSSPVPMSPGEAGLYTSASIESLDSASYEQMTAGPRQPTPAYHGGRESRTPVAVKGERTKHRSRSRQADAKSRTGSRAASRRRSPDGLAGQRGRSKSRRDESAVRSPSSPEPMQFSEDDPTSASSVDPALRIVSQNRHRLHSRSNRQSDRSMSAQRQRSPERRTHGRRSRSRQPETIDSAANGKNNVHVYSEPSRRRTESTSDVAREPADEHSAYPEHQHQPSQDSDKVTLGAAQYVEPNRRTKQLAQAELEARRLSLQRRPSAPAIPFPGQEATHSKSLSTEYAPPLMRAYTDTNAVTLGSLSANPLSPEVNLFARSRPTTPRVNRQPAHTQTASVPDVPSSAIEPLSSDFYRPSSRTPNYSGPSPKPRSDYFTSPEVPSDMPKHPAFSSNIGTSRPSSRNLPSHRQPSPARAPSRDRSRAAAPREVQIVTIGEEDWQPSATLTAPPPLVPELQHLAMPPPPPPPPAPPKDYQANGLRIHTEMSYAQSIPLPPSAYQHDGYSALSTASPANASEVRHRRERSGAENQIVGKIRNFAGRMRSNSRGRSTSRTRDNPTRSPPIGNDDAYSPYESLPSQTQQAHQQLATVIEGR